MSSDRVIIDGIKVAQDLRSQNLAPTRNLTDAATVMRLRELIRSQAIRSALERSSDTVLAFGLRAVEQVISDQCDVVRIGCCDVSALGRTVFKPSAAPLPPPKPAIACTS